MNTIETIHARYSCRSFKSSTDKMLSTSPANAARKIAVNGFSHRSIIVESL
ncbi:MAG: hypothetical protein FWG45_04220 [Oscillospiraceae bacterium]|nr:hypothetical protein [Oscillospiraceae bacterium]